MRTPDFNPADREEALFAAACDLPPDQRAAYLDRACGDNAMLRARLEVLLEAAAEAGDLLEQPPVGLDDLVDLNLGGEAPSVPVVLATENPGGRIGRYKLLQQIGEGGCGVVYMAEQEEPVRRRVALKIIKLGMDTKQVVARFEAERQALALMDHPNIAQVFDGGATDGGRPYFVMELVRGTRITTFCDEHQLSTRERLDLFVQVCSAIQHAHQKGIIHRDLKPSNVLVTMIDGKPVPKVIDFGIAKATGQLRLTDKTLFTAFEQFIGTPAYMSPEQAEMSGVDVDTRSDIYSLGVLLYELLTSTTPFDTEELVRSGIEGIRKTLREQEPLTPSTRLNTLAPSRLTTVAGQRRIEAPQLLQSLRGDLDWIVMKALDKERARRYESASAFAQDVQRHLNSEAVLARPPSRAYLLQKLVRRNKLAVAAATAVTASLVAGLAASTWLYFKEQTARKAAVASETRTEHALAETKRQRDAAVKEKQRADDEAAVATAVSDFLQKDLLSQADPRKQANANFTPDPDLTVREALDRAAAQIDTRFTNQPQVEASIRRVIGDAYLNLGDSEKAIEQLEKSLAWRKSNLGPEHPDTLSAMLALGRAWQSAGKLDHALPLYEETVRQRKLTLGLEHHDTLTAMGRLAMAYDEAREFDRALALATETLGLQKARLGPAETGTLITMNNLGRIYQHLGKLDQALALFEEALRLQRDKHGMEHPDTITYLGNLATAYRQAGKYEQALPLLEETVTLRKAQMGPDHPHTLSAMGNLALGYKNLGKFDQALPLFEQILEIRRAKLGPDHRDTRLSMKNLALAYQAAGKPDRAPPVEAQAVPLQTEALGRDNSKTFATITNLAQAYRTARKFDLALPLYEEALSLTKASLGPDNPTTLIAMNNLAVLYGEAGRREKSIPLYEETLSLQRAKLGAGHPDTVLTSLNLGRAYISAKRHADAEPLLLQGYEVLKAKESRLPEASRQRLASFARDLVKVYAALGQPDKAAEWQGKVDQLPKAKAAKP